LCGPVSFLGGAVFRHGFPRKQRRGQEREGLKRRREGRFSRRGGKGSGNGTSPPAPLRKRRGGNGDGFLPPRPAAPGTPPPSEGGGERHLTPGPSPLAERGERQRLPTPSPGCAGHSPSLGGRGRTATALPRPAARGTPPVPGGERQTAPHPPAPRRKRLCFTHILRANHGPLPQKARRAERV
jgi:hypothetical protein